ncbi:hypothetical protein IFO70_32555 [Phormidium tenue FACHB-886]|nr:hypothetical protein [Phormidium tenue FACHB-886]
MRHNLFERYKNCPPPVSPQTFLQRWELDYPDLARLTGMTRDTVRHWFSSGAGSRPVPQTHYRRSATVNERKIWRNW